MAGWPVDHEIGIKFKTWSTLLASPSYLISDIWLVIFDACLRYLISDIWCLPGVFVYSDVWDIWGLRLCLVIYCFWRISIPQHDQLSWPGNSPSSICLSAPPCQSLLRFNHRRSMFWLGQGNCFSLPQIWVHCLISLETSVYCFGIIQNNQNPNTAGLALTKRVFYQILKQ